MRQQILSIFCPLLLVLAMIGLQEYRVACAPDASIPLEATHFSQQTPASHSSFHHSPSISETSEEEAASVRQIPGKIAAAIPPAAPVVNRAGWAYQANELILPGCSFLLNCNLRL